MIEYNTKNWFRHVIEFRKADTLRILLPEMVIVALYTAAIAAAEDYWFGPTDQDGNAGIYQAFRNTTVMHSLLGFVLSLLVVFRTNTAYDRWWEGRKLWGALVNTSRNLSIKIHALLPAECDADRVFFQNAIPDYCFALKGHLRGSIDFNELTLDGSVREKIEGWEHTPNGYILFMYRRVKELLTSNRITNEEFIILDQQLQSFADIQGGCERILKTPIPFTYNIFLKKFIFFYILTLPLGFVAYFGYWAVPISVFVFYVLVSMEIIAEEIEDPFGTDANDLPTDAIAETIRLNVNEIFQDDVSPTLQQMI
ncbi:MAG: bestrophin family ion channel [Pirellulaceae bacterium]